MNRVALHCHEQCLQPPRESLAAIARYHGLVPDIIGHVRQVDPAAAAALRTQQGNSTTVSRALATSCHNLQLQQCIRIAVRELGHVGGGERDAVEKVTTLGIGGIGIVDREHDAVDAEG